MLKNVRLDDKSIMWKREIHQCLLFAEDDSWSLAALSQRLDAAEVRPRSILNFVEEANQKSLSKVLGLEKTPELPCLVYVIVNKENQSVYLSEKLTKEADVDEFIYKVQFKKKVPNVFTRYEENP